jgi:hypothetical protein
VREAGRRAGDGQRPAGVGRAGAGGAGRQAAPPSINRVYHLDRGYERLELNGWQAVGALIERVDTDKPAETPAPMITVKPIGAPAAV